MRWREMNRAASTWRCGGRRSSCPTPSSSGPSNSSQTTPGGQCTVSRPQTARRNGRRCHSCQSRLVFIIYVLYACAECFVRDSNSTKSPFERIEICELRVCRAAYILTGPCALKKGDRVVSMLPVFPQYWILHLACIRVGR